MANQYCTAIRITGENVSEIQLKIGPVSKNNKKKCFVTQKNEKYTPIRQIVYQDLRRAMKENLIICESLTISGDPHTLTLRKREKDFPYIATVFFPCVIVKFGAGMLVPFFLQNIKSNISNQCESTREELLDHQENKLKITEDLSCNEDFYIKEESFTEDYDIGTSLVSDNISESSDSESNQSEDEEFSNMTDITNLDCDDVGFF